MEVSVLHHKGKVTFSMLSSHSESTACWACLLACLLLQAKLTSNHQQRTTPPQLHTTQWIERKSHNPSRTKSGEKRQGWTMPMSHGSSLIWGVYMLCVYIFVKWRPHRDATRKEQPFACSVARWLRPVKWPRDKT